MLQVNKKDDCVYVSGIIRS